MEGTQKFKSPAVANRVPYLKCDFAHHVAKTRKEGHHSISMEIMGWKKKNRQITNTLM